MSKKKKTIINLSMIAAMFVLLFVLERVLPPSSMLITVL